MLTFLGYILLVQLFYYAGLFVVADHEGTILAILAIVLFVIWSSGGQYVCIAFSSPGCGKRYKCEVGEKTFGLGFKMTIYHVSIIT